MMTCFQVNYFEVFFEWKLDSEWLSIGLLLVSIGVNPGGLGVSRPPDFGLGVVGGHGRVVKHYCILSCTGSMFESDVFSSKIE